MDYSERLEAAGFSTVASQNPRFFMVHRQQILCLVEVATLQPGSPMLMTENGFATLVWKENRPCLSGRGFEETASQQQLDELKNFTRELSEILRLS